MNLQPGDPAPTFTLPDQHGEPWSLQDRRGTPVVLYFYPRDNTSGCTSQACDVRDHWDDFAELDVEVVGISPDDSASHAAFRSRYDLPHTLLADTDHEVLQAYGAWGPRSTDGKTFDGVIRSSVVIDEDGAVLAVFDKIRPKEQSSKALQVLLER